MLATLCLNTPPYPTQIDLQPRGSVPSALSSPSIPRPRFASCLACLKLGSTIGGGTRAQCPATLSSLACATLSTSCHGGF
eukprot:102074-Rhodomonas_salina.3